MGCPAFTYAKGNALTFSVYLVRKSIAIASSFAFLTDTWLTTIVVRQADTKSTMIPKASKASIRVTAATFFLFRIPERKCLCPLRSGQLETGDCAGRGINAVAVRS